MNQHLQRFFNSFKLGKEFACTFLAEAVPLALIYVLATFWLSWWNAKLQYLLALFQALGVGQMPTTAPSQGLIFFYLFGTPLLVAVFSLFLYSYAQALIWNYLQGRKVTKKTYWRWNALHLALLSPLAGFALVFALAKVLLGLLVNLIYSLVPVFYLTHVLLMDKARVIINNVVTFYLLLIFLSLLFFIYWNFAEKYQVWSSLGLGFASFSRRWKKLLLPLFFAIIAASFLREILLYANKQLLYYPPLVSALANLLVAVLFLAWLRLYIVKPVAHESQ